MRTKVIAARVSDEDAEFVKSQAKRRSISPAAYLKLLIKQARAEREKYLFDLEHKRKALAGEQL